MELTIEVAGLFGVGVVLSLTFGFMMAIANAMARDALISISVCMAEYSKLTVRYCQNPLQLSTRISGKAAVRLKK